MGVHQYLTAEEKAEAGFTQKRLKQAYGIVLPLLQKSASVFQATTNKVGDWRDSMVHKLAILETQLKELYVETVWMWQQNYRLAIEEMNHYVIFARAFCDCYYMAAREKTELVLPAYLNQVKALCNEAGLPFNDSHEAEVRGFFDEAKNVWESRLLNMEDKRNEVPELLDSLKKAVALQLGKFNKLIGLGFYDTYEELLKKKKEFKLDEYIAELKKDFAIYWGDELLMRNLANMYYAYNRYPIESLKGEYFKNYAEQRTRFKIAKRLLEHSLNIAIEKYLKLYEYLVEVYYDNSVEKYAGAAGAKQKELHALEGKIERLKILNSRAMDIFGYYGNEVKSFVTGSSLYQCAVGTLRLDIPYEFLKSNALRVLQLGGLVIKKFKDGMTIIYDKGTNSITVVIETVKNPGPIKDKLSEKFSQLKSVSKGYYLMLDFDADGWVSMSDFLNSMGKLHKYMKECDYIGETKALYMKAIGYIHLARRAEQPAIEMKSLAEVQSASK